MTHYTDYSSFSEALVGFVQYARESGFPTGLQTSQDTIDVALEGLWLDKDLFEYALASLFCSAPDQRGLFATLYKRFWRARGTRITDQADYKNQKKSNKGGKSVAVMVGRNNSEEALVEEEEAKTTSGANAITTTKKTDFAQLSKNQSDLLDLVFLLLIRIDISRISFSERSSNKSDWFLDS